MQVLSLDYNLDGSLLAAGLSNGAILFVSAANGRLLSAARSLEQVSDCVAMCRHCTASDALRGAWHHSCSIFSVWYAPSCGSQVQGGYFPWHPALLEQNGASLGSDFLRCHVSSSLCSFRPMGPSRTIQASSSLCVSPALRCCLLLSTCPAHMHHVPSLHALLDAASAGGAHGRRLGNRLGLCGPQRGLWRRSSRKRSRLCGASLGAPQVGLPALLWRQRRNSSLGGDYRRTPRADRECRGAPDSVIARRTVANLDLQGDTP